MKKTLILIGALFFVVATAGSAAAASTYATSVEAYDGWFMNWDSTSGFYHNTSYDAGADLDQMLGESDNVFAGWGGDANGGSLVLSFDTAFASDGVDGTADIIVSGCGFAYQTPFSLETGAITVSASSDGVDWTVISDYAGYDNQLNPTTDPETGDVTYTWEGNEDFAQSSPGVLADIMSIDLDDAISAIYTDEISYLKFELGDGTTGTGRAFFVDCVEGVNAVPVPAAVWLLGSGLAGLIGIRRRSL